VIRIETESYLSVRADQLADRLLESSSEAYETMPFVKREVPDPWVGESMKRWPVGRSLHSRKVLLFGVFPIDDQEFKLTFVCNSGFIESSKTTIHEYWTHQRTIFDRQSYCQVKDVIEFSCKKRYTEELLRPLYRGLIRHRHRRLRNRYGVEKIG